MKFLVQPAASICAIELCLILSDTFPSDYTMFKVHPRL